MYASTIHLLQVWASGTVVVYEVEGKHNYFKDLAHRVKCFKNIPKTLASRHLRLMCYWFAANNSGHSALFKDTMFGPGKFQVPLFQI